jgi:Tfp pilus assembly protein PilN
MAINLLPWRENKIFRDNLKNIFLLIFTVLVSVSFFITLEFKFLHMNKNIKKINLALKQRNAQLLTLNITSLQNQLSLTQQNIALYDRIQNNWNNWFSTIQFLKRSLPFSFNLNQITWATSQLELTGETADSGIITAYSKQLEKNTLFKQIIIHHLVHDEQTQLTKFTLITKYKNES